MVYFDVIKNVIVNKNIFVLMCIIKNFNLLQFTIIIIFLIFIS